MKIFFIVLALVVISPVAAAESLDPLATLKQKNSEVDRLLRTKTDPGSPAEKQQKENIKIIAATLLSYQELTKRAMADHWKEIKPAQQTELTATLKELIENNYVKQIKSNLDYAVTYKTPTVDGNEATVGSVVKVKTKGKATDAEIVYKMLKIGDRWMVWDVVTDEVSLMRNYKGQFHRIITDSGFPELLKRMKSKLQEDKG